MPQPALTLAPTATRSPEARRVWRVSQIVQRADQVLREKAPALWVEGEVSGWKRYPSGHCYFTLKDDSAELSCTMWATAARTLPIAPENGMQVLVYGQIGIWAQRGRFQLEVSRLEGTGVGGLWERAREQVIAALRAEGLLDEARKRALPAHPRRVGVVTSAQSAALQDMWKTLRRKAWWVPVLVSDCAVEGAQAAPSVAAAIRRFGASASACPVDVVIVARGGGSVESLWAYNTEEVARAIAACPVPVISAVGHETDYTVADLVADQRAATPTAGAEHAVPDGRQVLELLRAFPADAAAPLQRHLGWREAALQRTSAELTRAASRRLEWLETLVSAADQQLEARSPQRRLRSAEEELERLTMQLHAGAERRLLALERLAAGQAEALHDAAARRLERLEARLAAEAAQLDARSPLRVLGRGYAVVSRADGRVVRAPADVRAGERLRVRVAGGEFSARAEAPGDDPLPPES